MLTKNIMPKPKKLSKLKQIDGQNHRVTLTSLDSILGADNHSKYKTSDSQDYTKYLEELDKVDLMREATNVGLMPIDDRRILKERLLKEFNKYQTCLQTAHIKQIQVKPTKELKALLADGANTL